MRNTMSAYWNPRTNDEGVPRPNAFHPLAVAGKIEVISPAHVKSYHQDGVLLDDDRVIRASAIIAATGYGSSWPEFMNGVFTQYLLSVTATYILTSRIDETLEALGLAPLPVDDDVLVHKWDYTTLRDAPPLHPDAAQWYMPIYRGIVPAKLIASRDFALNGVVVRSIHYLTQRRQLTLVIISSCLQISATRTKSPHTGSLPTSLGTTCASRLARRRRWRRPSGTLRG